MNIPPEEMMYDGPAEHWLSNGLEFLGYYQTLCHLKPWERMLDVGSGLGRKTIPLMSYLTTGSYEGFDCKKLGVDWCKENIKLSNFNFQFVDVYAPGYNVEGTIKPEEFRFPFADEEFDFVVLASVFTHMQYSAVAHYMDEIYRVLKPGGRSLITWFICDEANWMFPYRHSYGWYSNPKLAEEAIAFDRDVVRHLYDKFTVKQIADGSWSGAEGLSHQDMVVSYKL